jgi:hypothetical protein
MPPKSKSKKKDKPKPKPKKEPKLKPYCGINEIPKRHRMGSMKECADAGQIRYYGLNKIDKLVVKSSIKVKENEEKKLRVRLAGLKGYTKKLMEDFTKATKNKKEKEIEKLKEEYRKVKKEYDIIVSKIIKIEEKQEQEREKEKEMKEKAKEKEAKEKAKEKEKKAKEKAKKSKK